MAWASTDNTQIVGNSIGTDFAGNAKVPNNDGIYLETATNTLIDSNVISGNNRLGAYIRGALYTGGVGGTGTVLTGNFVGTNRAGNAVLANTSSGIQVDAGSKGTRIGHNNDGVNDVAERNIVSGNGGARVAIGTRETDDTIIRGNYIGTDVTGEIDFGNSGSGIIAVEWFYSPVSEGSPKRTLIESTLFWERSVGSCT